MPKHGRGGSEDSRGSGEAIRGGGGERERVQRLQLLLLALRWRRRDALASARLKLERFRPFWHALTLQTWFDLWVAAARVEPPPLASSSEESESETLPLFHLM